jgi:uncharacterized alkaline shock family protein YloU
MRESSVKIDTKEFELPETLYSRDIETRVIQMIILQSGNLIDMLLGREIERIKGIYVEQDSKNPLVHVKIELKVDYGISIPKKAEEVQTKVVEEITQLTGLHVASVHVVVRGLNLLKNQEESVMTPSILNKSEFEEFSGNF